MSEEKQAKRFFVSGRVQGVGFRYFSQSAAQALGLVGYVRNLSDGRVEVYAIGTSVQLIELARYLKQGPSLARVSHLSEVEAELLEDFSSGFSVEFDR